MKADGVQFSSNKAYTRRTESGTGHRRRNRLGLEPNAAGRNRYLFCPKFEKPKKKRKEVWPSVEASKPSHVQFQMIINVVQIVRIG